jgi:hypothetical protein
MEIDEQKVAVYIGIECRSEMSRAYQFLVRSIIDS